VVGGRSWHFAKSVGPACQAASCVYASGDERSLALADLEDDDALTVQCDVTSAQELARLGKYDAIVVQHAFQHIDPASGRGFEVFLVARVSLT